MKTPIIDSLWEKTKGIREYHVALEETAKKLEADRAELLEALKNIVTADDEAEAEFRKMGIPPETEHWTTTNARDAIAKAEANFPATGS